MNAHISIDGRKIGTDYAPYIIAEMSANHNGSIENAFKIIEQAKHCGADDSFSLEPDGLQALCRDSKTAWQALGRVHYGLKSSEQGNVQFRRSLYFVKDLQKGDTIDETCIRSVRPGFGIAPKHFDELIGKRLTRNVQANTKTDWADFE